MTEAKQVAHTPGIADLKISYRRLPNEQWEGVLKQGGKIVWACGHSHKCRDNNHSGWSRGAARYCARDELARRAALTKAGAA